MGSTNPNRNRVPKLERLDFGPDCAGKVDRKRKGSKIVIFRKHLDARRKQNRDVGKDLGGK